MTMMTLRRGADVRPLFDLAYMVTPERTRVYLLRVASRNFFIRAFARSRVK